MSVLLPALHEGSVAKQPCSYRKFASFTLKLSEIPQKIGAKLYSAEEVCSFLCNDERFSKPAWLSPWPPAFALSRTLCGAGQFLILICTCGVIPTVALLTAKAAA